MDQAGLIDLTRIPAFRYGGIEADPHARRIAGPDKHRDVEPRVIQVLLALHGAAGRMVLRDELASACWGSLDVSEDAINRAVAKLRVVLADVGAECKVETVRGAGYRLVDLPKPVALPRFAADAIVPAIDIETRALSAMFEGTPESLAMAVTYLERLVAGQPDVAAHHGSLAMALLLQLAHAPRSTHPLMAARARDAANLAQQLQPNEGRSLAALAALEPTFGNWLAKDARLEAALAASSPGVAPLLFQRVLFLAHTGQMGEALAIARPLAEAAPLVPWIQAAMAHLLAATGDWQGTRQLLTVMHGQWPRDRLVWLACYHLWLDAGQVSKALALVDHSGVGPVTVSPAERSMLARVASALATGDDAARTEALADCRRGAAGGRSYLENAILCAAHLGAADDAAALAEALFLTDAGEGIGSVAFAKIGLEHVGERNAAIMFLAPMRALLKREDMGALLVDIGLDEFWGMKTGSCPPSRNLR